MWGRFLGAALLLGAPAHAGTLEIAVRDSAGAPVRDAVVTVTSTSRQPRPAMRFAWPRTVAQKDIQFSPYVLIVPVGASVAFPNLDKVRHHVYSFSKPKKFELKLYGREESRAVTFDKPGTVALGCNIHDSMSAFIKVVDTPWAAKSDAGGNLAIAGLPEGSATVTIWHPSARSPGNETRMTIAMPGNGKVARAVRLNIAAKR